MSRLLILGALVAMAGTARADEDLADVADQSIGATVGIASGGRVTPGGLRVGGVYHYQFLARDWFEGGVSFTFGGGSAGCFRDRDNALVCDHHLAAGRGVQLDAGERHYFATQGAFRPFSVVGVSTGIARFGADDVTGVTLLVHGGGGVRTKVRGNIAVVVRADLALGVGGFNRGLGGEPQLGLAIAAGAEFDLR